MKIKLNKIKDIQEFCTLASGIMGDVDIVSGRYLCNAKSLLGVLSLDLSKPIEVVVHEVVPSEKAQFEKQLKNLGLAVD